MTPRAQPGPVFTVRLQAPHGSDGIRQLRRLLKIAWRSFRMRCLSIEEERR
jgi:hypothetical protein